MAASMTTVMKAGEEQGSIFTRMPWYYQMAMLIALVGLLLFAADALLYSETRSETEKLREQIEALKVGNAQAAIIRQNLADTEKTLQQKREEIENLKNLLPDEVGITKVYDAIKQFVANQRLDLRVFTLTEKIPSEYYTAQPVQVEVTGTYDGLGNFFSQLGFFARIVNVTDVEVKQAEDSAQEQGRTINSRFIVTAFFISPENLEKLTMKKPDAPIDSPPTDQKRPARPARRAN